MPSLPIDCMTGWYVMKRGGTDPDSPPIKIQTVGLVWAMDTIHQNGCGASEV